MKPLDLLIGLRAAFPDCIPSLTLDKETGAALIVTLCNREAERFDSYKLDPEDLDRPAADIVAELARLRG